MLLELTTVYTVIEYQKLFKSKKKHFLCFIL